ncbi:MAG: DoxX family protein [Fimbriimonadales bacterium]
MASSTPYTNSAHRSNTITATDAGILLLRIALAVVFIAHGGQKVFGWFGGDGLATTVANMSQGGIPSPLAYLAAFTEFFGGVAVHIGLFTRLASLGLAITMGVAMFKVHFAKGFFLADKGYEYTFVLMLLALALMILGPGRLAIADLEAKWVRRR